ncbi:nucleotide exchange factor GrpE [Nostoc linckia FACHB-104]|nr:nucleotide exchange factor GrpE [Nostoc linckia FACHB-104]
MNPFNIGGKNKPSENRQATVNDMDVLKYIQDEVQITSENVKVINQNIIEIIHPNIVELLKILEQRVNSEQKIEDIKKEVEQFKESIKSEIIKELRQNIEKGHYQNTQTVGKNNSLVEDLKESLLETRGFMEKTFNSQIQEMNTQLITQRQELGNLQRKIESWQDFAVEFFQYMERTLEIIDNADSENEQSSKPIVLKVVKDFEKYVNSLGLERISPSLGDELDENFHKAIEERESKDVQPGKILVCKEWGYRINGKLYEDKRAKVILAKTSPEQYEVLDQADEIPKQNSESQEQVGGSKQVDEASQEESKFAEQSHTLEQTNEA